MLDRPSENGQKRPFDRAPVCQENKRISTLVLRKNGSLLDLTSRTLQHLPRRKYRMQIKKIQFEKIFDVAARRGDFSFKSGHHSYYGINLRRGVIPREGAPYAVAFGDHNDWSTMLGWRDLETGAVSLKHSVWDFLWTGMTDLYILLPVAFGVGLNFGGLPLALTLPLVPICLGAYRLISLVKTNRKVSAELVSDGKARR